MKIYLQRGRYKVEYEILFIEIQIRIRHWNKVEYEISFM